MKGEGSNQAFIQKITCGGLKTEADGHMVGRNVEGADNKMRKASTGKVWDAMSPSDQVSGSILSSHAGSAGEVPVENDFSYIMGVSEPLIIPLTISYIFWLRSERCLGEHLPREGVDQNTIRRGVV